ncbi:MAG: hypothetical protein CVV02_18395 [Firmicutes bacterium HGW-Firmicutes-7]|nr:MAG: hypothetical protein CVV02_18395 [Firmicutes bacterium HGW-Firmicutes-7]
MKRIFMISMVALMLVVNMPISSAASHSNEVSKKFTWWVGRDTIMYPLVGYCNTKITEDYTISGYPAYMNSTSRNTWAYISWDFAEQMYVTGCSTIKYYTGSTQVYTKSLTRDYNVLVSPSWKWTYYVSESDYGRTVSNGLIAKSEHSFMVVEALVPTCIVKNQLTIY